MSTTDHRGSLDHTIPQWKRDLILRRRTVGRVLSAGSGSVQLTCPGVVVAVRYPEYSVSSDSLLKSRVSEREQTVARKNMRLYGQITTATDFLDPGLLPAFSKFSKKESYSDNSGYVKREVKSDNNRESFALCSMGPKKCNEFMVKEEDCSSDSSEEFKYGPGIVSKLKSRYLSLTLRESQNRVRPTLPYMRRATSLENILDGDEAEKCEESKQKGARCGNVAVSGSVSERCRSIKRGNKDSMKRAGSVETLIRYDRGKGNHHAYKRNFDLKSDIKNSENDYKNICRSSIGNAVEEKELPPPDLVKHTLKIFENSKNSVKCLTPSKININSSDIGSDISKKRVASSKQLVYGNLNKVNNSPDKNSLENIASRSLNSLVSSDCSEKNYTSENLLKEQKNGNNTITPKHTASLESSGKRVNLKDFLGESEIVTDIASGINDRSLSSDNTDGEKQVKQPVSHLSTEASNISSSKALSKSSFINSSESVGIPDSQRKNCSNSLNNNYKSNMKLSAVAVLPPNVTDNNIQGVCPDPEVLRSVSPVLVRAPLCILSAEVNINNSNTSNSNQMKQLGVVRPMVTNKAPSLNQAIPPQNCSLKGSHTILTERAIEKNLINSVKSVEQSVTNVIVSLKKTADECIVPCGTDLKQNEKDRKGFVWDSRKPNTMVFNFSNRKTVPDYIENDGLILASRRDNSKRLESAIKPGIIFLGDGTCDSSNDFDEDGYFSNPPSPCDFTFEGDNILINGKSNIQSKPKLRKMKIQFNDEATTMFEYPSESSLLDDQEVIGSESEREGNTTKISVNPAAAASDLFRCSSLAMYTPSKSPLNNDFELGVTKTCPPPQRTRTNTEVEKILPVEEECLRPADESATVMWSSETAVDLLF